MMKSKMMSKGMGIRIRDGRAGGEEEEEQEEERRDNWEHGCEEEGGWGGWGAVAGAQPLLPSMTPSEIARTTHGSMLSSLSSMPLATSWRLISDLPCAMVAMVSNLIFDMASWISRPCSLNNASFFLWKSRRSLTVPVKKTSHNLTRSPRFVFASALTLRPRNALYGSSRLPSLSNTSRRPPQTAAETCVRTLRKSGSV